MKNSKLLIFLLSALMCATIGFCAWSGNYLNDDWVSGLVGGVLGCSLAALSGCLFGYAINNRA